jgi:uncharacterized protein (TIGR02001 family)
MRTSIRRLLAATVLAGSALAAVPAYAQDETDPPSEITVSGYVQGVSDYRFRGLSLTDGGPAVQGSINVNHASGFYVGTWASSLDESVSADPVTGESLYGSLEVDLYAGWTGALTPALTADVGVLYYAYPDGRGGPADYVEPYASLSTTIGPVSAKFGAAYAPEQDALGGDDNIYVYTDVGFGIPNVPLSFSAHLGYADGAQSPNRLTGRSNEGGFDYSVGATFNLTPNLSVGAAYVGVDGNSSNEFSDDTVVATLKLAL